MSDGYATRTSHLPDDEFDHYNFNTKPFVWARTTFSSKRISNPHEWAKIFMEADCIHRKMTSQGYIVEMTLSEGQNELMPEPNGEKFYFTLIGRKLDLDYIIKKPSDQVIDNTPVSMEEYQKIHGIKPA